MERKVVNVEELSKMCYDKLQFLGTNPSPALIEAMVKVFIETEKDVLKKGDIVDKGYCRMQYKIRGVKEENSPTKEGFTVKVKATLSSATRDDLIQQYKDNDEFRKKLS